MRGQETESQRLAEAQRLDGEVRELVAQRRRRAAPFVAQAERLVAAAQELDARIEALGEVGALDLARDEGGEQLAELFRLLVGSADLLCAYWNGWDERDLVPLRDLIDQVAEDGVV